MVKMLNLMLCVLYYNKKKSKSMEKDIPQVTMRAGGASYTNKIDFKTKDVNREKRGTFYNDKKVNSSGRYDNYKHTRIT